MNKFFALLTTVFLSLGSFSVYAAEIPADPNAETVNKTITAFMEQNQIPGVAVQLYVDGKPSSYYFGYANLEKKTPLTKNTIFELGSISKIMTNILLAQELDFAKMNLTDSVKKYVKDLPNSFNKVTLKELATHTAGLPFSAPKNVTNQAQLQAYLNTWSSDSTDQQWIYSNIGTQLLGAAVEKVNDKDLDKLYRRHILLPLGMQLIGTDVPAKLKKFYAQGYKENGKPAVQVNTQVLPAASGVKASAEDMQHFLSAAIGLSGTPERVLYPIRMTQAAYVKLPDRLQGLGWQVHPLMADRIAALRNEPAKINLGPLAVTQVYDQPIYNGDMLIDKTGATDGFRSYVAVIPNKKSGIVILANKHVSDGAILNAGRKILFEAAKLSETR